MSQKGDVTFLNASAGAGVCMYITMGRYLHFDANFSTPENDFAQIGMGNGSLPTMMTTGACRTVFKNIAIFPGHNVIDLGDFPANSSPATIIYLAVPANVTGIIQNICFSYKR